MACHHPSIWQFLEIPKKEQDMVEVKQAFCITGRNPTKRKLYRDREQALKTLVDNDLSHPRKNFLKGIAYQFAFIDYINPYFSFCHYCLVLWSRNNVS